MNAGRLDDLVNLPRSELVRALAPGFLADEIQDLRFRGGKAHIVPDAEQYCFGVPRFSMTSELAETGAGAQCGNDVTLILASCSHGGLYISII